MTKTIVLDAGALIALERANPIMKSLVADARFAQVRVVIPDSVLAQVWRTGAGRQARISTLIALPPSRCLLLPLDTAMAKRIGAAIGRSGHPDIADAHVVLAALDHSAAVITSDRDDLLTLEPNLKDVIIDI